MFEVFNVEHPMASHAIFGQLMAAGTPKAFSAASDILRHEIWAGVYLDGDNRAGAGLDASVRKVLKSPIGFGGSNASSVLAIPAGHPFRLVHLDTIRRAFGKTQAELLGQEPEPLPPDEIMDHWGRFLIDPEASEARRGAYSVLLRTAGRWETWERIGLDYERDLDPLAAVTVDWSLTWALSPAAAEAEWSQVVAVARGVVTTLLRHLQVNRPGDLFLVSVAELVDGLPARYRPMVWRASLRFLAQRPWLWPDGRPPTATVLDLVERDPAGQILAQPREYRVELPADVWQLLGIDPGQISAEVTPPGAVWWGTGLAMPLRLAPWAGLESLAGAVYGAAAEGSGDGVVARLGVLVSFLGRVNGGRGRYLPSPGELREHAGELVGVPAGQVRVAEVDAAARVSARYARETGKLPGSVADLEAFARGELSWLVQQGGNPVLALGRLLRLADEIAGDPEGWPRGGGPGLGVVARVAALAREAGGLAGGDGLLARAGLEPLLGRLFGPRPGAGADGRLGALVWLVGLWIGVGDPGGGDLSGGDPGVAGLEELAGRLLGDLGGRDPVAGFGELYRLLRGAGAGGWLTPEGLGDVVLAVQAACGDLGVGVTGLSAAGFSGYLGVLTGGEGGFGTGPGAGMGRLGLADLKLLASWLRAERGLAPAAALEPGELAALVRGRAGADGDQGGVLEPGVLEPGVLGSAARGLREWVAGLLGVAAERVTAEEVDAVSRAVAGFSGARGRSPGSGEELGGFAGRELAGGGVQPPGGAGGPGGVVVAYGRWLRLAAELAAQVSGPGAVAVAGRRWAWRSRWPRWSGRPGGRASRACRRRSVRWRRRWRRCWRGCSGRGGGRGRICGCGRCWGWWACETRARAGVGVVWRGR